MLLVFYISSHGFGHATRDTEVINEILSARPDTRIVIRSRVPQWFLEQSIRGRFELQPCDTDTGMVQIDSLTIDVEATVRQAREFYADFDARADREAEVLRELKPAAVIGDIPPLAFAAAARAGVPGIAFANFTWDWIYEDYDAFRIEASETLDVIRRGYASTTLALRLPFAGGFGAMRAVVRDTPLAARRSRLGREASRRILGLSADRPIVLGSFGGYRAPLDFAAVARGNDITLIVTGHEMDRSRDDLDGRLRWFDRNDFARYGVRYEDLVAAADVVVTKPGYGIVSECIANGAALLYTSRGHFVEHDVFVSEMPRVLRCRFIDQHDVREGRWQESIRALLEQPAPPDTIDTDGATVAAHAILDAAGHHRST